jgi:hypothetical protein
MYLINRACRVLYSEGIRHDVTVVRASARAFGKRVVNTEHQPVFDGAGERDLEEVVYGKLYMELTTLSSSWMAANPL